MDFKTYSDTAPQSAAGKMHFDVANPGVIDAILDQINVIAPDVDAVKKGLFYGKPRPELADWSDHARPVKPDDSQCAMMVLDHDVWHGVLGMLTEVLELLKMIREGEFTKRDLADEGGDVLWYFALMLRGAGISFDEVALGNIKKLAARFPEGKFDLSKWEQRDKENEAKEIATVL